MITTSQYSSQLISTGLGRLRVQLVGHGEPVVLWHSMFVDASSWSRVVSQLARCHRLVLIDGPSSGGSEPLVRAGDIGSCADAAEDVLRELEPIVGQGPVDWVGSAWGGHVGMHLAATRPERIRSLVAVSSPTNPISADLRRKVRLLVPVFRLIGARGPVAAAIKNTLLTEATRAGDPEAVELVMTPLRRANRAGMARAIHTAILNRTDLAWAARRITCPVLFVTTDDRGEWAPEQAQVMAAQMPDATEVTITGSRVLPAVEQPQALIEAIERFWGSRVADLDARHR